MTSRRFLMTVAAAVLVAMSAAGCGQAAQAAAHTIPLQTLNNSGVTGTVVLTAVDDRRTRVEVRVDPAGHADMPSHIHPGTCVNLVPQPKYPLQNVKDGHSVTVVNAPLAALLSDGLAVNIHRSNEDLKTYTACAELK